MKNKQIYISIIFFLAGISFSQAQEIKAAVCAGIMLPQVDGDQVWGYHRIGANIGAQAMMPLNTNLFLTMEVNFNQKGAYQKKQRPKEFKTGEYDLRLNYAEIPLLLLYNDRDIVTYGGGFSWARLVKATEIEHGGNQEPYTTIQEFKNNDFSFIADIQFKIFRQFYFNFRYAYSIVPIRQREFELENSPDFKWVRDQFNNTIMLRINYRINEKKKHGRQDTL